MPDPGGASEPRLCASVPDALRPAFAAAQRYVAEYFGRREEHPERGTIEIDGERYLLIRAAALSTEFFDLVAALYADRGEAEARRVWHGFLYDIAHAMGRTDAERFAARMGVTDPIERLSAGPIHFAFAGWAFVDILPESRPSPDEHCLLVYDHPYSFEADSWLRAGTRSPVPVCVMNAGYSSGWCEASFGVTLAATEVSCRATGAERCRFVMAPPWRLPEHLRERAADTPDADVPEFFGRKRAEDETEQYRLELEREVTRRTAELRDANARLTREIAERERSERQLLQAQKMEAIGTLAGGIAHDFNNLLTAILGGTELLAEDLPTDGEVGRTLAGVRAAAGRAGELTAQLLTLGRRRPYEMGATRITEVVNTCARLLGRTTSDEVHVRLDLPPDPGPCRADAAQLEQALLNLGINARDAMPDGGTLTFHAACVDLPAADGPREAGARRGPYVVLRVTDTGTGIPAEIRERVFEPFFTTKPAGAGTGLGLAMVYDCMRAHDGWVSIEDPPGGGTTMSLWFPFIPIESAAAPPAAPEAASRRARVLVVDDADLVREIARLILGRRGYRVETAPDGEAALEALLSGAVTADVVVTDLSMPRCGGRELLQRLRAHGLHQPVVLMSGFGVAGRRDALRAEGFADVITKPFDGRALAQALQRALDTVRPDAGRS